MNTTKVIARLLLKLSEIFKLLPITQSEKDKLLANLIESTMQLSMLRVLENKPSLVDELKRQDISFVTKGGIKKLDDFVNNNLDENLQGVFVSEWSLLLDQYIESVLPTLNTSIKQQVQQVWSN